MAERLRRDLPGGDISIELHALRRFLAACVVFQILPTVRFKGAMQQVRGKKLDLENLPISLRGLLADLNLLLKSASRNVGPRCRGIHLLMPLPTVTL